MVSTINKTHEIDSYSYLDLLEQEILSNKLLKTEIIELNTEITELKSEVDKLKSELAKHESPNIPSSKKLYPKQNKRISGMPRTTKKRERGGSNKGDETWVTQLPAKIVKSYVDKCISCSKTADKDSQMFKYSKSVIDLPKKIVLVHTKYHIYQSKCTCGTITVANKPTLEGTCIGPNLLALNQSIRFRTGASFEKISQLLEDQTNVKLSQTAIHKGYTLLCDSLETVANEIATDVMNSEYINIDETSHKLVLEGKQSYKKSKKVWVWVAGKPTASYYHVDLTRSKKALQTMFKFIIPEAPPPISVSDAYPAYINTFEIKQFCWAHLLRDSKELEDKCENGLVMHKNLTELYKRIKLLKGKLVIKNEPVNDVLYDKISNEFTYLAEAPSCNNTKKMKNHLKRRSKNYITCLKNQNVPMTNNHAERLLRTVIVHRSNGKPFRSIMAMKQYGILLTVLMTWKLQKKPIASSLRTWITKQLGQSELIKK